MTRLERFALLLAYNPDTGVLTWREKPSRGVLGPVPSLAHERGQMGTSG